MRSHLLAMQTGLSNLCRWHRGHGKGVTFQQTLLAGSYSSELVHLHFTFWCQPVTSPPTHSCLPSWQGLTVLKCARYYLQGSYNTSKSPSMCHIMCSAGITPCAAQAVAHLTRSRGQDRRNPLSICHRVGSAAARQHQWELSTPHCDNSESTHTFHATSRLGAKAVALVLCHAMSLVVLPAW